MRCHDGPRISADRIDLRFFYRPVVRTTANAAIKGRAAELSVSQFIRDRETVETELFKAVKLRLEGVFM